MRSAMISSTQTFHKLGEEAIINLLTQGDPNRLAIAEFRAYQHPQTKRISEREASHGMHQPTVRL